MDLDSDYLDFGDDSDHCCGSDSSSDEGGLDIILNRTPEQKRKVTVRCSKKPELSSEDEFEREMNQELNNTVKAIEAQRSGHKTKTGRKVRSQGQTSQGQTSKSSDAAKGSAGFHDDVYFDSDEEEMVTRGDKRVKRKNPVLSNDDLLYDPDMDDNDQAWVDKRRQNYQPGRACSDEVQRRLPRSDAVLDCPACMNTLCRDCQRHDKFENQYRAMFVMNCSIDKTERLKYPKQEPKHSKRKMKNSKKAGHSGSGVAAEAVVSVESPSTAEEDMFNPVRCTECKTVVAVYDKDDVYHFFNVLASYT